MINFILLLSTAVLACGSRITQSANLFTYEDNNGNIVTEDLDAPVIATCAPDINKQKFMLYTQSNVDKPFELKEKNLILLNQSPFNHNVPTKFLIHGWQNSYSTESMQLVKNAYLARSNVNIIICDYEVYNSPYVTATRNAKKIGSNIGLFISFLIKNGLKEKDIHIIGHSLGAHIAGFAAKSMDVTIPRITGLDPAGPLFNNKAAKDRLDQTDATYVEAVHTSSEFGMTNALATADYYPHGGRKQPACSHAVISGGCDHAASYRYWSTSIPAHVLFPAYVCKSVSDAQDYERATTKCTRTSYVMGDNTLGRTPPGVYYIDVPNEKAVSL